MLFLTGILLLITQRASYAAIVSPSSSSTGEEQYDSASVSLSGNTIRCSRSLCTVSCSTDSGCSETTIDASNADRLQLTCSSSNACSQMSISSAASMSTEISCTGSASCQYAQFNVGNSRNVSVACSYSSASSLVSAPCFAASIKATSSAQLTMSCNEDYSCYFTDVFCPQSNGVCDIDCGQYSYYSCKNLDVFLADIEQTDNLQLECGSISLLTCMDAEFKCGTDASLELPSTELTYGWIDYNAWYCINDECCPPVWPWRRGSVGCTGQTQDCVIDCSVEDCVNHIIDGSMATSSFTVHCNSTESCIGAGIRCPTSDSSAVCVVNCANTGSCKGASIEGSEVSALQVVCDADEACLWAEIHCPSTDAQSCAVSCTAGATDVCKQMIIDVDASYTLDYLVLECAADGECDQVTTHCNNFGGSTDDSKRDSLLFFNETQAEWQCHNFTQSDCCPWKSVAVADDADDGDIDVAEVADTVSQFISTLATSVTVLVVLIILGIACCVCNCIWGPKQRRLYDPSLQPAGGVQMAQSSQSVQPARPVPVQQVPILFVPVQQQPASSGSSRGHSPVPSASFGPGLGLAASAPHEPNDSENPPAYNKVTSRAEGMDRGAGGVTNM